MKNENQRSESCVFGIAPSSRGFGFAVLKNRNVLVDWGVKTVKSGKKNETCLARFIELVENYQPSAVVFEDCSQGSQRSQRIQALISAFEDAASAAGIKVSRFSRKQVNLRILRNRDGTKHHLAEKIAAQFFTELQFRLPQKRRTWENEPYQLDIFDAVALAQCFWWQYKSDS